MISLTGPVAAKSTVHFFRLFTGLVLSATFGAQLAFAQQGSDCLACHSALPATFENLIPEESDSAPVVADACDYSTADLFAGWGWNSVTQESCPPLSEDQADQSAAASNCDYTNADSFAGWGWNPVTRESCPPVVGEADPHARFSVCSATLYDVDGDGFGWENEASCIITSESEPPPVFTNRETGNQVNLVRANWNGNRDIANRVIQCDLYYFNSNSNQYRLEPSPFRAGALLNNQVFPSYQFRHQALPLVSPFLGPIDSVSYVDGSDIFPTSFASDAYWTTNDGRYIGPTVLQSPYVELINRANGSRAIRTWHLSRFDTALNLQFSGNRVQKDGFFECWDISGSDLVPTRGSDSGSNSTVSNANQCDYSNADSTGGWGWNPVTRESCAPQQDVAASNNSQGCDYSNANSSNGWGWNPVTLESCAPLTGIVNDDSQGCDYSNAGTQNGYGWNPSTGQSCPPR